MSLDQAIRRHRAGDRTGAERLYREAIRRKPTEVAAWHGLGLLAAETGNWPEARKRLERAVQLAPKAVPVLCDLARVAHAERRLDEAAALLTRAIEMAPSDPTPCFGLVALLSEQGRYAEALAAAEAAVALAPDLADAHLMAGTMARHAGALDRAVTAFRAAVRLAPRLAVAQHNLGAALTESGRGEEAVAVLQAGLALDPRSPLLHQSLGVALRQLDRLDEAVAAYRRALDIAPEQPAGWFNLGIALKTAGDAEAAIAAFGRAAALDPGYLAARWAAVMTLPIVYDDAPSLQAWRVRWQQGLAALEAAVDLESPAGRAAALMAATSSTNFYLHYQGRNDRDDQARYGALVGRIAAASFPGDAPARRAERAPGQRIRVGFLSAFLHHHSIFKTHAAFGLRLHPGRFDVRWFYAGPRVEEARTALADAPSRGQFMAAASAAALVEAIRGAELDILIHLDIGMDPVTQVVAALRLAPVQANFGGHPVTSGLAAIDYFLTSEAMEPADGEAFYTERLVRLPHLASCYPLPPVERATAPVLPPDARGAGPVFLNLQSLFKLLPEFDPLFPAIAKAVGPCRFWFLRGPAPVAAERFQARLGRAFAVAGLDADDYVRVLPPQPQLAFYGLIKAADVVLDGVPWSGNNSTMEALACGKPVVTWPQGTMRSRHSAAILEQLGAAELVAASAAGFVELAARLGRDTGFRGAIAGRIMAGHERIFDDPAPVEALARWIEGVA